jgi:hypothetical protein
MTDLAREWFLWAFDMAMQDAVRVHGDAARLTAYEARRSFDQTLPHGLVGVVRDSDVAGSIGEK